jgi:hypothetical protein
MIDSDFSIKNLYEIIDDYFDSPQLEKVQDNQNISMYMCKIATLLAGAEQRYLIAICNIDNNPIGKKVLLSNINWKSFQTRTLVPNDSNYKIISHSYSPKNNERFNNIGVNLLKRYEDHTEYFFEDQIYNKFIVSLLHKNKNLYEYPESGNLPACLETFKTIILIL